MKPFLSLPTLAFVGAISVIAISLGVAPAGAQEPVKGPALSPTEPTAEVTNHGWSEAGQLVLEITLHAPTERPWELGHLATSDRADETVVFSTKDSYLTAPGGTSKYPSLMRLPPSPIFGFYKASAVLSPGSKRKFTGAYRYSAPKPDPGKPIPAKLELLLHLPMGLAAVPFSIPNPNLPR